MRPHECPSKAELAAFHWGDLPEPQLDTIADHLEGCPNCDRFLAGLDANPDAVLAVVRGLAAALPSAPPALVGDYEVLGELGRGGMGVVYKARHRKLNRVVALKMILAGSYASGEKIARFLTEAQAIARLKHPGIVAIHEIGVYKGRPFFSLEFCPGGSLDKKLAGTPMPPAEAAALLRSLAEAVQVAHNANVIHRDLKPANVLLSAPLAGSPLHGPEANPQAVGNVKITDFGLAKKLDEQGTATTGNVMGTPSYMPPEQARGRGVGPPADIYALGAILYECLTGRPPFRGATHMETLSQVVSQEPVPPRQLNARVPRDLETVCLKCLQKEPQRRYATAAALADDLRRFLEGQPVLARPVGLAERAAKWVKRRPWIAVLLALLVVVTGTGAGLVAWMWHEAITERNTARYEKQQADDAREDEKKQRKRAERAELEARTALYANLIEQAQQAREGNDLVRAMELLNSCPEDLRGWEWQYLHRLVQGSAWSVSLNKHPLGVTSLALSPDGESLVCADFEGNLRRLDPAGRALGGVLQKGKSYRAIAFRPDGKVFATARSDGFVEVWQAGADAPAREWKAHPGSVNAVAFADQDRLATCGEDGTVRIHDASKGEQLHLCKGHLARVTGMARDRAGKRLASCSFDGTVRLWDAQTGQAVRTLRVGNGRINTWFGVAFSPDGSRLVASGAGPVSGTGVVAFFDAASGEEQRTLSMPGICWEVAFSPDGKRLAVACEGGEVALVDTGTGQRQRTLRGHFRRVQRVTFTPDGQRLVTAGIDGMIRAWDVIDQLTRTVTFASRLDGKQDGLAFAPDGQRLVALLDNGALLWDPREGDKFLPLVKNALPFRRLAASRDGTFAFIDESAEIKVWHLGGHQLATFRGGAANAPRHVLAMNPQGTLVAACTDERTVVIRDVDSGREIRFLRLPDRCAAVALSCAGHVAAISQGGTLAAWNLTSQEELWSATEPVVRGFRHLAYDRLGERLVLSGMEDSARIRDASTGASLVLLQGKLSQAEFSPDGRRLLSVSYYADGHALQLHDTTTGQAVFRLRGLNVNVASLAFSPDGRRLAHSGNGRADRRQYVQILDAPPD